MNEEDIEKFKNLYEWHKIEPMNQWFDPIKMRWFVNPTDRPIHVGFGHDRRALEIIAFTYGPKESANGGEDIQAQEGEIIEE